MINIVKNNNDSFKVTFDGQQFYLQDGVILLPMNSLILVIDESDIATFKKVDNGDVLFTSMIDDVRIEGESVTKSTIYDKFAASCTAPVGADPAKEITSISLEDDGTKLVLENFSGGTIASADTTMFVADSYVKDAYTSGTTLYLVIETISGETLVAVDMDDVLDDYYTISETDTLLAEKLDVSRFESAEQALAVAINQLEQAISGAASDISHLSAYTIASDAALQFRINELSGDVTTLSGQVESISGGMSAYTLQNDFESLEQVTAEALLRISAATVDNTAAISTKLDASAYTPFDPSVLADYQPISGMSDYATTGQVATKQNQLIAGSNITISADTISSNQVIKLTQAQYDALEQAGTVDPDKLYVITDAPSYDMSDYTLTSTTDSLSGQVITISGNVATLSGQVATKQDQLTAGSGITISGNVISAQADLSNFYTKAEIDNAEQATSAALNELNLRKLDASAYTPFDPSVVANKLDTSAFTSAEQAIAVAINGLDGDVSTLSGQVSTISGQVASKAEIVRMTTQEYQTSSGSVTSNQLVIITDAQAVDMSQYATTSTTASIENDITSISGQLNTISGEVANKANIVRLTSQQFADLTIKDQNTLYIITDATVVDMNNYYTKAQIDAMLGN